MNFQTQGFNSDIAFSPSVKQRQTELGSREIYEKVIRSHDWEDTIAFQIKEFIANRDSFYMASVNANGQPYVQHRGGEKGFLKVLDDKHLAFADYSGNRQYISIGNFDDNPKVHLFLMDYPNRTRLKIWGEAEVLSDNETLISVATDENYKAKIERIIKIKVKALSFNCPQHIKARFTIEEIAPQIEALENQIRDLRRQLKDC